MYDAVLACCRWLEDTPWGVAIRGSSWMYPVTLWIHFAGLSIFLGSTLAVDVRRMRWIGFGVAFLGGFLLLSAEATTYVTNIGFCLKLAVLLPLALIWHAIVQKQTIGRWARLIEFVLWISVVTASVGFLLTNAVTHP
jgi:hypothetical protein